MEISVKQGDSLWYYSQLFKMNIQLIIDSNEGIDAGQLFIGQRIKIPGFLTIQLALEKGDSFWAIAQKYKVPVAAMYTVNPKVDASSLQVGQVIQVPLRVTWMLVKGQQEYTYAKMVNDLASLIQVYPFVGKSSIGASVLGKEIPGLSIGKGDKQVNYNGSFHANEWITTPVIMTFINDYLLALTNQTSIRGLEVYPLYQQTMLSIVPMVNPDGVNLVLNELPSEPWLSFVTEWNNGSRDFSDWKANIRGVDLNDQFPAEWELERERNPKVPGPRDYGGESPLSEPETIAMANLTKKDDYAMVLAFHTQGEVIYWGFENLEPPESKVIVEEFARVSGYEPVQTIDSYAGYKDWFIQDWRRPGFTIELGSGVNPLPLSQFDEIYQEALGIFLAGLYL
ncbi:LysM peptidoglycan-binding domain-containing protein [Peribacillus psychrosaccharolyticus]|uniref:LysM peptidoglycan-binding domain-containing protein n=1 Tax=Peribacillus psychrosaccharolyticus TaxID=1407 RepID=A0A974NR98_PERPY|nr:M14 family metallopeptidase [Peribacillus psychrosaccharolyticus]MEC2057062.1 M14 family metallopeptidase [Peribacillus psychrosaccharolyticus]MED3744984.1 M14 family metallopeptidase [Peribacillus psychrosaccharolyticus]QQT02399.1 LysM peptidoglycan-binding domain-containing protein [Peribacillus psychrosaccharolyticus]